MGTLENNEPFQAFVVTDAGPGGRQIVLQQTLGGDTGKDAKILSDEILSADLDDSENYEDEDNYELDEEIFDFLNSGVYSSDTISAVNQEAKDKAVNSNAQSLDPTKKSPTKSVQGIPGTQAPSTNNKIIKKDPAITSLESKNKKEESKFFTTKIAIKEQIPSSDKNTVLSQDDSKSEIKADKIIDQEAEIEVENQNDLSK